MKTEQRGGMTPSCSQIMRITILQQNLVQDPLCSFQIVQFTNSSLTLFRNKFNWAAVPQDKVYCI